MSRSKRSEPATGVAAESEKEWKRKANRKLRHAATLKLQQLPAGDPDALVLPVMREVTDEWDGPKDGKFRFDPKEYPRLMRK